MTPPGSGWECLYADGERSSTVRTYKDHCSFLLSPSVAIYALRILGRIAKRGHLPQCFLDFFYLFPRLSFYCKSRLVWIEDGERGVGGRAERLKCSQREREREIWKMLQRDGKGGRKQRLTTTSPGENSSAMLLFSEEGENFAQQVRRRRPWLAFCPLQTISP